MTSGEGNLANRGRLLIFSLLAGLLFAAGCDTFGEDDTLITLTGRVTFDYAFNADDVTIGELNDIVANASQSVQPILQTNGFSLADLRAARVRSADVEIRFPLRPERMAFANRVVVKLRQQGRSDIEVATGSSFANQQVASLTANSGQNVTPYVSDQSFTSVMQINPALLASGEQYQMRVRLDFELDVEGF